MERRLGDRVAASRRRIFVGRAAERELFGASLVAETGSGFAVLFLQGDGGVGKSALLRMFADQAAEAGYAVVRIDGHDVRPNSESFLQAAGQGVGLGPVVVLVDTYELLEPLDDWLREEFVPRLSDGSVVVIAGRRPLPQGWLSDPGWRELLRVIRLGNLSVDDATRYLATAGVPADLHAAAAAAVHGHPLGLALVADVLAERGRAALEGPVLSDPDVLEVLVSRLLDVVPDEAHRCALAVCALARFTTESLLRDVLDVEDARPLFDWLHGLSCVEAGSRGLYPHDLARDVLEADLHWRDEGRYQELSGRILRWIHQRIGVETGLARREAIFDLLFLMRTNPVSSRYWNWETFGRVVGASVDTVDRDELLDLVTANEGPESAAIAARWLQRQPEAFTVYRVRGELAGMVAWLTLTGADDDLRADPVAAAAWRHVEGYGPLAPGEQVLLNRFGIDRDVYQDPSPAVDLNSVIHVELTVTRPQLAWVMMTIVDTNFWAPFFATIGHHRAPGPDASVGNRRYALFVRDARRPWTVDKALPAPPARPGAPLSRETFADAVRAALRDLGRPDLLAGNPLLALREVRGRGGGPEALCATLSDAAAVLRGHPRDEKLFRAIDRTYLRPAPTQERAAELLGLPFSTYRRHRREGLARIIELLWAREAEPDRN